MSQGERFRKEVPIVAPDFLIENGAAVTRTKRPGTVVREIAVATFNPSANTAQRTIAAHGLGVYLPDNAIVTRAWYEVVSTFTSAGADAGTIALSVQTADDIVAAVAISNGANPWDAGLHGTKVGSGARSGNAETALVANDSDVATMVKLTAIRQLTATVATQALTAGKLNLYVEYVLGD